ncbi:MAG: RdgB/HAM1 family non-canonical purine NTP pyrophosphatase [Thermomicrobiales bacterium]|nr:RdgB/HAM1 family non-canonical purine NTP pyrophosphatase [Thermomicrobiales bacterium]
MSTTIVLASNNPGKLKELARILPAGFEVSTIGDFGIELPPETGLTFEENAQIKAQYAARETGHLAIGDDSGLEVDALDGAPGVYSARYAGEPPSDNRNTAKLLAALLDVPASNRTARFRCAIVLAAPNGATLVKHGSIEGIIGFEKRGSNGFGYDPVFAIPDGRSFAELSPGEKDDMSHRGRALRALIPEIAAFAAATKSYDKQS